MAVPDPESFPALLETIEATTLESIHAEKAFDAVVVGAGAAGGMAGMLLTEAGMKVLVLDACWEPKFSEAPLRRIAASVVPYLADPRWLDVLPSPVIGIGRKGLKLIGKARQPVQSKCFAWLQSPDSFVDDRNSPYVREPGTQFDWFRARQIGGRMVIPGHGRQYYRLGARDFSNDDGLSPTWPFPADELDPWYAMVEERLLMSGMNDGCAWVPDSRVRHVLEPTAAEQDLKDRLVSRWPDIQPILGRSAPPLATLEIAARTGRLSCRRGAIVKDIKVDRAGQVQGVVWHDRKSARTQEVQAPVVFLCASSLETTRILLNSGSAKQQDTLGARSGALGKYLMDHVCIGGEGFGPALPDEPVEQVTGRCVFVPRFDRREDCGQVTSRGFGIQLYRWSAGSGRSYFNGVSFAEMCPRPENRVTIDRQVKDAWGIPVLRIACRHSPSELARARDQSAALAEIGKLLGVTFDRLDSSPSPPGTAIHECGTARMGTSPENSVVDPNNQCWDARGLYVTDGAAFPSQGAQNPTLTILALTARACAFATRSAD